MQHAAIESQTGSSLDHSLSCAVLLNEEHSHCSLRGLEEFMDWSALQLKDIAQKMNSN